MVRVPSLRHPSSVVLVCSLLVLQPLTPRSGQFLTAQGAPQGRGAERRADPCGRLQSLPNQAQADDQRCLQLGNSSGVSRGDFNGDGVADLAVGTPNEGVIANRVVGGRVTPTTIADAGTVTIIYGSTANGLSGGPGNLPALLIHQDVTGVEDDVEANDKFGAALASGDFNGDGYSDLAVSVPGDNAVQVFRGAPGGLNPADDTMILGTQFVDNQGLALTLRPGRAWGDYNGDGFGDLAIEAQEFEGTGVRANVMSFTAPPGSACSSSAWISSCSTTLIAPAKTHSGR